jgi:hypothetical protein
MGGRVGIRCAQRASGGIWRLALVARALVSWWRRADGGVGLGSDGALLSRRMPRGLDSPSLSGTYSCRAGTAAGVMGVRDSRRVEEGRRVGIVGGGRNGNEIEIKWKDGYLKYSNLFLCVSNKVPFLLASGKWPRWSGTYGSLALKMLGYLWQLMRTTCRSTRNE